MDPFATVDALHALYVRALRLARAVRTLSAWRAVVQLRRRWIAAQNAAVR